MTTSVTQFCKDTGLPGSTVFDYCKSVGISTTKGLSDSDKERVLDNFRNHKALNEEYKGSTLAVTEPVTGFHAITPTEVLMTTPMAPSLTFEIADTSHERDLVSQSTLAALQQAEDNRKALEQATLEQARRQGAELAVKAHQARQAAFTEATGVLNLSTAEVLSLMEKQ